MKSILDKISDDFKEQIAVATTSNIAEIRNNFLGRKSELNTLLKSLGSLSLDERKEVGVLANKLNRAITEQVEAKESELKSLVLKEPIDVTAPGRKYEVGHIHPINSVITEISDIFVSLGYEIAEGPEIEDDWHNFEALNMPKNHSARDMQDTFYLTNGAIPRTQTSSVQIRYMENNQPPIKIISPGKVHRNENEDATHSWVFHQIEGLVIDKNVTFADLKGTLDYVAKRLLGPETKTRFRPNFFPYTEPSAEMDASCPQCKGVGCKSCGGTGWLELLGSGMVHPEVLRKMNIDPEVYSGFAFGVGVERVAMIKHKIPDIRFFWHPDIRFLEQF